MGTLPRSPVDVVTGTAKWGYKWRYDMSTAQNTPGACRIHQNPDAQARQYDAGLAFDRSADPREPIARANVATPMDVCALPKVSTLPRMTGCVESPIDWR